MNESNLLFIAGFPNGNNIHSIFIKERVNYLKSNFNRLNVIFPSAASFDYFFHSEFRKNHLDNSKIKKRISYDNVRVYFPHYLPLPTTPDFFMRARLKLGYNVTTKIIKKEKIDFNIIHSHNVNLHGYIGSKLKLDFNKPLVITGHGGDVYHSPFKNKFWFDIIRNNLNNADRVITVSKRNYDILINKLRIDPDKISIIPNGFDPKKFKIINKEYACKKLDLPLNKKIILTIGSLKEIKGQIYLIESIRKLKKKYNENIICIIIGSGILKNKLEHLIDIFDLKNIVKLVGSKPHESIPFWINACDVFVLSSLDEGNPTVLVEALGCGKPVVASDVGGISEIIISDEYGLLAEPKDSTILAKKLEESLEKKWKNDKISYYANNNFSWIIISKKIMKIYSELL